MSPRERSNVAGTSSSATPFEQFTWPGAPATIFSLRDWSSSAGSQPISSSAPPSMTTSAWFSFTMKLGLASTKCGSSVGFASVVSVILSPPISLAMDARSGVVATTFSFACAFVAKSSAPRKVIILFFISVLISVYPRLKFVRPVRAEEKFQLQPDGMRVTEQRAVVVIVLQPDFGKFAGIKCQRRRHALALAAKHVLRIKRAGVAVGIFAAQTGDPAWFETPKHLRIRAPVAQRFGGQGSDRSWIGPGVKNFVERLGLPGDEWKTFVRVGGLPFPIQIHAVNLCAAVRAGVVRTKRGGCAHDERLLVGQVKRGRDARRPHQILRPAQPAT